MPALPPYIPARDADINNFVLNFSALITAAPATYGLVSGDALAIAAAVAIWSAAYAAAVNPPTRTPVTVEAKDNAKTTMLATLRPYAQSIALNAGVASSDKIALGINPRTTPPTKITAPTTNPVLTIDQALSLQHVVRYRDSLASPSVKSKPYGVVQTQIFCTVSATPITDPEALAYKESATKSPVAISFASGDVGKKAYYAARWITRTGLVGPWSPVASFTVAA